MGIYYAINGAILCQPASPHEIAITVHQGSLYYRGGLCECLSNSGAMQLLECCSIDELNENDKQVERREYLLLRKPKTSALGAGKNALYMVY